MRGRFPGYSDRFRLIATFAVGLLLLGSGGLNLHRLLEPADASHDLLGHELHPELAHEGCDSRDLHVERFRPSPHEDCQACLHARGPRGALGLEVVASPAAPAGPAVPSLATAPLATVAPSEARPRAPPLSRV